MLNGNPRITSLPSYQYHTPSSVGDAVSLLNQYGIVGDSEEKSRASHASVVFLDMPMPIKEGIDLFHQLRKHDYWMPIVILTSDHDEQDILDELRNGNFDGLIKAIKSDLPQIGRQQLESVNNKQGDRSGSVLLRFKQSSSSEKQNPFDSLTPREYEILELVADGQSNKIIARNLGITEGTVKLHIRSILKKLNIHSRVKAAVMYLQHYYQNNS